jgi:hypothetical protein
MRRWYRRYFGSSRRDAGSSEAEVGTTRACPRPCPSPPRIARAVPRSPARHGAGQHPPGAAGGGAGPESPARPVLCLTRGPTLAARAPLAPRTGVTDAPVLSQGGARNPSGGRARGTLGLPSAVDQYQSLMDIRTCVVHPNVREEHSPLQTCIPWCGAPLTGADPEPGSQPPGGESAGARRRVQDGQGPHTSGGPPP